MAILAEFLCEGFLVSAVAGILGVLAAAASVAASRSLGGAVDIPRLAETNIDATVLGVAALSALLTVLFVSGLPALRSGSSSWASGFASRSATVGRARHRARHALVVSQVALALVLLVGSGLMARSVWRLRSVEPGFEPASAITPWRPPIAYLLRRVRFPCALSTASRAPRTCVRRAR
jgi:hypothetical protein